MANYGLGMMFKDLMLKSFNNRGSLTLRHAVSQWQCARARQEKCGFNQAWHKLLFGQNSSYKLRKMCAKLNQNINAMSVAVAQQCNSIAAQRIRRAAQIMNFYKKLGYDGQSLKKVVEKLGRNLAQKRADKPLYFLFGASIFSWENQRITDEEITDCVTEIHQLNNRPNPGLPRDNLGDSWEKIIDRAHLVLWRKPVPDSHLYEYKVYGTYFDIPARAFYNVQCDFDYRKQWDKLVIALDVIDEDPNSGCDVVRWVTHYPYPMYSREYVYVRRRLVDPESNIMMLLAHATDHPTCPVNKKYVRVHTYKSSMVIKPHSTFDENGFDYILTYFDDPQSAFPSVAYNWMASTGVPDFVDKIHSAAKDLSDQKQPGATSQQGDKEGYQGNQNRIPM